MGNLANQWVKRRRHVLIKKLGGKCKHRGCGEKRHSKLQFAHVRRTKLSGTGPRGRKERMADINAHPKSYTLRCSKHHTTDFRTQHIHFQKLGRRSSYG
jgi:hypothetical protein